MTTNRPAWATTEIVVAADRRRPVACGCGQDLDVCTGRHCPRCGHTLPQQEIAAAA